jgi:hypothetical protein
MAAGACIAVSCIRTVTVGPGIAPDLLTLPPPRRRKALAGSRERIVDAAADTAGGDFHPALRTLVRSPCETATTHPF